MLRLQKRYLSLVLCTIILLSAISSYALDDANTVQPFSDVPSGSYAYKAVNDLRALGITNGIGNNKFGYGKNITRAEFITFLVRLMKWEMYTPPKGSFLDNQDKSKYYYSYIETAYKHGIISKDTYFRPTVNITREDLAIFVVRCLGYETLSKQPSLASQPFSDVTSYNGYINIAKDLGIVNGVSPDRFSPKTNALKEQAAVMMMRMYDKLSINLKELHAFYAHNAYTQKNFINGLNSLSFGWSRLDYDLNTNKVILNTTSQNENDFVLPDGFSEVVNLAKDAQVSTQLNVFASNDSKVTVEGTQTKIGLVEFILKSPEVRQEVINNILVALNSTKKSNEEAVFDGVVIDFESLKGTDIQQYLNTFLSELKVKLLEGNKKLYVAVHPAAKPGEAYFNGYDYRTIGNIADKVILMAHDYNAKTLADSDMNNGFTTTPLTPFDEIYFALKSITDKNTGVQDLSKVWLQISFGSAQWQTKDGKVINRTAYEPTYQMIRNRIINPDGMENVSVQYSKTYENPYITYYNKTENINNIIWYEDSRSVTAKINLAKMFGIQGVSLWRLGNVPDYTDDGMYLDIWQQINNLK